jgi:predicted Zn-dependent protease
MYKIKLKRVFEASKFISTFQLSEMTFLINEFLLLVICDLKLNINMPGRKFFLKSITKSSNRNDIDCYPDIISIKTLSRSVLKQERERKYAWTIKNPEKGILEGRFNGRTNT